MVRRLVPRRSNLSLLAERLRTSVLDRARAFEKQIERELSQLGSTGPGVRHALQLFAYYAGALAEQVEESWEDAPNAPLKLANMRALNEHLRDRIALFDNRFRRGHLAIPKALTAAVERECNLMGVDHREAVLTVGPPMNFVTFVADLGEYLFRLLSVERPKEFDDLTLVLIAVPELEGTRAAWQPVVVGHELAHYLQVAKPFDKPISLSKALKKTELAATTGALPQPYASSAPRVRVLEQIAARWLNEVICDAYAVFRYGAAGYAALAEFLEAVGACNVVGATHPPGSFRIALMRRWLGTSLTSVELEVVSAFDELAATDQDIDWADSLSRTLWTLADEIWAAVEGWSPSKSYQSLDRSHAVEEIYTSLDAGIPGSQDIRDPDGSRSPTDPADVVNACWLAIQRGSTKPINRLSLKALDSLGFVDKWMEAGGATSEPPFAEPQVGAGVLTEQELNRRVLEVGSGRLVVTPLLPGAISGASVDLRLGNKFVVFERSSASAFDALKLDQDPRSMQSTTEKSWGDVFYLHPGELVLAATLEYLVLPSDLSAQVITRSSYGRLGLLSATAVQVHPYFSGCLTLELVNLGQMPMAITPGERIAQLMLFSTVGEPSPPQDKSDKYRFPTGPEFSKIRTDSESEVLRTMRAQFDRSRQ